EHGARFTNLEQKDKEKTNLIAKLEQNDKKKPDFIAKLEYDVSLIKRQDKSMQDVEPGISDSYPVNSNDVPEDINLLSICVKPKSLEGKEIDNFLIEKHNEQICNEIREKKLQHRPPTESSPKEDTYIFNIKSSIPPEQKKEQGLIQEISTSIKDQNDITRISQNNVRQNHMTEVASDQDIICLYQNACDAEKDAIKANQEEILCWCFYAKKFKGMVKNFMANGRVGEKKAKGQVYDFIIQQLPNTK
ncbi:19536_t:CDS:2, partial [Gigaspora rosea]